MILFNDGNDDDNNGAKKPDATPVCVCDLTDQANDDRSPYFHKNRGTNVNSTFIEDRVHTIVFFFTFTAFYQYHILLELPCPLPMFFTPSNSHAHRSYMWAC